ncbi:PD-(D/E)XK nuclease domain-containing protein [Pedobacter sp. AW31-3R]|uniref:PD-(D/E)XK nuclease domain-containing protein n=1 Tax=Pedobacter sp. AW31-3R TaxID=3445781 RepID=UPI003F9FA9BC
MTKIEKLEKYISDFFSERYEDIDIFYWTTHKNRHYDIYKLEQGTKLMDFVIGIHGNIQDNLNAKHLIPHKFVTPDRLFNFLTAFKAYLNDKQYLLDLNIKGEDTDYIIVKIQEIKDDLVQMIDYSKQLYDMEDRLIPYQDLRYNLITKNIPAFVDILKSILATVSYAIAKTQEGYFHSNIHLILKLLGFEIISEELTNNGRIDAVIRFIDIIYIIEFKFSNTKDLSKSALEQIKEKKYAQKFLVEHKEIIGIGVSFNDVNRNIDGFVSERLSI